ncbi:competence protein [Lactobacillus sp.] [Lactiplantibacillus mudanjiangensis]|uniref:competence protein CoiA n=1 Tax=Lactiplantibacillus mudanjiangensis TaxID=1296538 RepID=UPI001013DE56|nr:competence protein [Lactobacillus sp.] [Lactiplantibacillus mudanjiangensis]
MLMAQDDQQRLIDAATAKRQQHYQCPGCRAPVQLKRGTVVTAHFAHQAHHSCQTFSEGETAEHLLGKQQLAAWFKASGYQVQLEAPLKALHQRPDVLVQLPGQPPLALEFQCSPLSVTRLKARTQGYHNHGYRVLWLLGSPYQQPRLRPTSKAMKFLQLSTQWGCYLVFWETHQQALQLKFNLLSFDGDPLTSQRQFFHSQHQSVAQLLAYHPILLRPQLVPKQFQRQQRRLLVGRLTQQPRLVALQTRCYQQGGTLATLPRWVYPMTAKWPILTTPFLDWYMQVFFQLRQLADTILSLKQLVQLGWQTLQPCLAVTSCIMKPRQLQLRLIQALLTELVTQHVLIAVPNGWRVNSRQLAWRR